jgi:hypothetical protein
MLIRISSTLRRPAALLAVAVAAVAAPLAAQDAPADADVRAIENFQLTVSVLNQMAQVQENMYATVKAHPELAKKYADQREDPADDDDTKSIDEMAKKLDRVPEMKAAVIKAGFTPRSYMIATMAMFQAAMASAVLDMPGADKSRIPANARANAAFLKAHAADFQKMQLRGQEIEKLTRPQSGDDADGVQAPDSSGARH